MKQPGAGVGPIIIGRAGGDAEGIRGFLEGHANKITEFDEFGFGLAQRGEFFEGVVDGEQLVVVGRGGKVHVFEIDALLAAAMTVRALAPSPIDQDAAHRLSGGGEEMSAVGELRRLVADQPQPGFVNERGRLQRLTGSFVRHPVGRQLAQLLINKREQLISGLRIALLDGGQDVGHIAHG